MKGTSRWAFYLVCLVAVVALSQNRARSQSSEAASATPFQIRQVAYLKASNAEAGDHFGCGGSLSGHTGNSIAISSDGSTMAVGAPHESSGAKGINGNQNDESAYGAGAVYVFTRRGDSWAQQAYIKASNPQRSAHFGQVVSLSADGNTMGVSAHFESSAATGINGNQNDDSIPESGALYVFTRAGNTWAQQAYIKASNTGRAAISEDDISDGDQFGYSHALSRDGNTLAVGAITEDSRASGINNLAFQKDDTAVSSGAVYVFIRTGSTWSQQAYLKGANTDGGDLFGYSVGLNADGNTLVVGGYDEDGSGRTANSIPDNLRNGSGAIYVFDRTDGAWRQTAYLKGSRLENADSLGYSVAVSDDGNTVIAGTAEESCLNPGVNPPGCNNDRALPPGVEVNPGASAGAAYVWSRTGNAWTEMAFLKSSNPSQYDWFGVRTAISGDGNTVVVEAQNEDSNAKGINGNQSDNSADESGAVYIFTRTGNTWVQRAYVKGSNTEAFDEFGSAISISRDGKTLVVGARMEGSAAKGVNGNQNDNSALETGAAYVFSVN